MTPGSGDWEAGTVRRRVAVALVSLAATIVLKAWHATWRVDDDEVARLDGALAGVRPVVAVFWHGSYLPLFATLAGRSGLIATSRSFRGAVIAGIARRFGYRAVQVGGRPHAAAEALREALGQPHGLVAVAVDGPLGPRHVAKPGAVAIAIQTGAVIIPVHAAAERKLVLARRWDQMELPLPFARITLRVGLPLDAEVLGDEGVEATAQRVVAALSALS